LQDTYKIFKKNNKQRLTEEQLTFLVDEVYKNYNIESDKDFEKGLNIYKEEQLKLSYIKDNSANDKTMTRLNMDTINVIPACFLEELYSATIEEKTKYELSIRKSKEHNFEFINDNNDYFRYIKADYSYETGLIFKDTSITKFF